MPPVCSTLQIFTGESIRLNRTDYDWICRGIVLDLCWICGLEDLCLLSVVIVLGLMSLVESIDRKDLVDYLDF